MENWKKETPSTDQQKEDLRKAELELAEAKKQADLDRKKQEAIDKSVSAHKKPAPEAVPVNDADKLAFEAKRKSNLEREKQAKIEVANKRSAFNLATEVAAIEAEYIEVQQPVSEAGRCPRCN